MADVRISLNRRAMRDMLRSQAVLAELERRAAAIARQAGPGNEVRSEIGRNRARAAVITATFDARLDEATNRTLTAALDAGRR